MDIHRKKLEKLLSDTHNLKNSNKNKIFEHYLKAVQSSGTTQASKSTHDDKTVFSEGHPQDRIQLIKSYFKWYPLSPAIRSKYEKSREVSYALQSLGNAAYKEKKWVDAVRLYSLSILFGIPGEPELRLACVYGNRSSALYYMGLVDEALRDIDLALKNGFLNDPKKSSKMECRKRMFETVLMERSRNKRFEKQLEATASEMTKFYQQIFSVKVPNRSAPSLEDSVDIRFSAERGRHLVANRDIPIGTTVLVERPFVAVLMQALKWDVEHCHHCFRKSFQCIPCTKCVFTMYCDEKCLSEAQEYHQYECPCLPDLHCNLTDNSRGNIHLAFKLMCIQGPHKLFQMFKKQKEDASNCSWRRENRQDHIPGSNLETGIYEPNSYRAMYNLSTNTNTSPNDVNQYLLLSLILSHTLDANSDFFDSVITVTNDVDQTLQEEQKQEFIDFVAELIAHHFETFTINAYGIDELYNNEGVTLRTIMTRESKLGLKYSSELLGCGTYATASLINHSCDQNVMRFFGKTFGTMAFVALKGLKKGQELLISYAREYGTLDMLQDRTLVRRNSLQLDYGFCCDCIACRNDWPSGDELIALEPTFCCPRCASRFPYESKMSEEFLETKLANDYRCKLCNVQYEKFCLKYNYRRHCAMLNTCEKLIGINDPIKAIMNLKIAMEYFDTHSCPPNYSSIFAADIFRDAIHHLVYCSRHIS